MADGIISISFKWDTPIFSAHPQTERIMKKEIRQQRADDGPLRSSSCALD
jgi:hypothetical protein